VRTTQECVEGRIISAPASWQGDPLRCADCGELVGPKRRVVVSQKTKTSKGGKEEIESEERMTVPSVGCRCHRRPTLKVADGENNEESAK
jgi:hypothetical protein